MIGSLVTVLMAATFSQADIWFKANDIVCLVDCLQDSGLVVQTLQHCAVVSESGKVRAEIKVDPRTVPLFLGSNGRLVISQRRFLSVIGAEEQIVPVNPIRSQFAQRDVVFTVGTGAVVFSKPPIALNDYDHLSGVGINKAGDILALLTTPMTAPYLTTYKKSDGEWHRQGNVKTPEIEKSCLVSILPRFNDLRFVRQSILAFIGKPVGPVNMGSLVKAESEMLDLTKIPLENLGQQSSVCYLFLMDVRDGWTRGVARLRYKESGERGGPRTGRLAVSNDEKFLYLATRDGVLRLSITDLLKRTGMSDSHSSHLE